MLYFTRWKALAIILTALVVCLFAVPNFFPEAKVKTWPVWAQRHIVLGLDLQGGSYLLLEVDSNYVKKEKLDQVRDDVRRVLRDAKIGYTGLAVRGDAVEVRVKEGDQQAALTKLRELSQPLGGLLGSSGQRSLEVADAGGGLFRLTVPQAAITERIRQTIEQSIQIVERRVNEFGTVEPLIQRQGTDRILVQVPGLQDPTDLKRILGKTAKMEFRMVDSTVSPDQAQQGRVPADSELLMSEQTPKVPYVIKKQVLVSGGDLTDAQPGFDQRTNEPIVNFRFNTFGLAQIRAGDDGECRAALCHRARQQGDFRARDPRTDHRRLGADFRQLHRAGGQRSRDPAARRRAAGAADRDRGAHRRSGPRPGLDREGRSSPPMSARSWSSCSCC